jgi:hypothetical protein
MEIHFPAEGEKSAPKDETELMRFGGIVSDIFWQSQQAHGGLWLDSEGCQKILERILTFPADSV